jgi:Protein of unknown function (DUF2934)
MQTSNSTTRKPAAAPKHSRKHRHDVPEAPPVVREERIRQAAYSFFEERGGYGGSELDDWLRAEALIDQGRDADDQAAASADTGH